MSAPARFLRTANIGVPSFVRSTHLTPSSRRAIASPSHDPAPDSSSPNRHVRQALAKLPARPPRLDGFDPPPGFQKPDRPLLRSLAGGRSPVGASYARARAPVFFPNVPLQLVRPSATDRADPFTAIFRCDLRLTKPDIYNYLRQIYGLGITSIRTAIYRGRYKRQLRSRVQGGIVREREGNRTFKKVWVGMDRPFFFPGAPCERWLDEQYMYSDFLNSHHRAKAQALLDSETDRRTVLPSGMQNKGERRNVLREILDTGRAKEDDLRKSVRKSLAGSSLEELEKDKGK